MLISTTMENVSTLNQNTRLHSLDALRGFDMLWIIGGEMVVNHLSKATNWGFMKALSLQMTHVDWEGFRFYVWKQRCISGKTAT